MNRLRHITLLAAALGLPALATLAARPAAAQWNLARFGTSRSRVYTTFGLDPALVGAVGYGRVLPVLGHDVQLTGDVGVVTARTDAHDFRARVGTQTSLASWRSVRLAGSATFITRGTQNVLYRAVGFGADLTGSLGVYRPRWFAAAELGKDKAIVTHLTHSDWYRANFYPDAKNGWYLDTGGTLHGGVATGLALGRTELVLRAGRVTTERHDDLLAPFYASVGIGFGF